MSVSNPLRAAGQLVVDSKNSLFIVPTRITVSNPLLEPGQLVADLETHKLLLPPASQSNPCLNWAKILVVDSGTHVLLFILRVVDQQSTAWTGTRQRYGW